MAAAQGWETGGLGGGGGWEGGLGGAGGDGWGNGTCCACWRRQAVEAIRSNQKQSEGPRSTQEHSGALRSTQEHAGALRRRTCCARWSSQPEEASGTWMDWRSVKVAWEAEAASWTERRSMSCG